MDNKNNKCIDKCCGGSKIGMSNDVFFMVVESDNELEDLSDIEDNDLVKNFKTHEEAESYIKERDNYYEYSIILTVSKNITVHEQRPSFVTKRITK